MKFNTIFYWYILPVTIKFGNYGPTIPGYTNDWSRAKENI